MATIVYLDVDDEITSAAARIRGADGARLAIVVPDGSRVATSRINFRLLAREAAAQQRELAIVAPDASTRALAGSAGLPVYATVAEYEAALARPDGLEATSAWRGPGSRQEPPGGRSVPGTMTEVVDEAATGLFREGPAIRSARRGPGDPPAPSVRASGADAGESRAHAAAGSDPTLPVPARGGGRTRTGSGEDGTAPWPSARTTARRPDPDSRSGSRVRHDDGAHEFGERGRSIPVVGPRRRARLGTGGIIGVGLLAAALVFSAVAGYVLLPAATITVVPTVATIGPTTFTYRADPTVSAVDPAAGVIPATEVTLDVRAAGEFPASGKRVEEERATGTVRFDSINTIGPVLVKSGTRVSTLEGIVFTTTRDVTVPAAEVSGSTITHGIADVGVRAQQPGPEGNVDAGAIARVPDSLSTLQVSVSNLQPTTGGLREEFPRVEAEDVEAALASLRTDLEARFAASVAASEGVPAGLTAFPETALLGEVRTNDDPAALVGQEVATFTLEALASGVVLAVDEAPLEALATERLRSSIDTGFELVPGSLAVEVGAATVAEREITFPVTGSARQRRVVDRDVLEAAVRGLPRDAAVRALAAYGTVTLELWPDWVTAVPTIDQRVSIVIADDSGG